MSLRTRRHTDDPSSSVPSKASRELTFPSFLSFLLTYTSTQTHSNMQTHHNTAGTTGAYGEPTFLLPPSCPSSPQLMSPPLFGLPQTRPTPARLPSELATLRRRTRSLRPSRELVRTRRRRSSRNSARRALAPLARRTGTMTTTTRLTLALTRLVRRTERPAGLTVSRRPLKPRWRADDVS